MNTTRRYTRDEALLASGATEHELADLESSRLIVAQRPWRMLRRAEAYYTEEQVAVLSWLIKARRTAQRCRAAARLAGGHRGGAGPDEPA